MLGAADPIPGNTPHAGCGRPHPWEHTPCWVRQTPSLGTHPMLGAADPIPGNTPMLGAADPIPGNTPHAGCGRPHPWEHTPCWQGCQVSLYTVYGQISRSHCYTKISHQNLAFFKISEFQSVWTNCSVFLIVQLLSQSSIIHHPRNSHPSMVAPVVVGDLFTIE